MKKTIGCIMAIIAMAIFVGCEEAVPMEYGFKETGGHGIDVSYRCAYRLEQTEFDKDNVTIQVYYGDLEESILGHGTSNLVYRMYFLGTEISDPWYETAYFIKEISSYEFLTEDYLCSGTKEGLSFRHNETMKIPEALFDRPEGHITFSFIEFLTDQNKFGSGKEFRVNFKVRDEKVILSVPKN